MCAIFECVCVSSELTQHRKHRFSIAQFFTISKAYCPHSLGLDEHLTPPYNDEPDGQKGVYKNRHFPATMVSMEPIFEGSRSVHSVSYNERDEEMA